MKFEIVPTEYANGHIAGADFGSKVRILMRSPDAVLFTGHGLRLNLRSELNRYYSAIAPNGRRASLELPKVRAKIVKAFGEGADEAALAALEKRGWGTALFNGGGTKLPLPGAEAARLHQARYVELSVSQNVKLDGLKTCRQCGKTLTPDADNHFLKAEQNVRSIEECQRFSNHMVISVHGFSSNRDESLWPVVERFKTWDGESYINDWFCNDKCAAIYGRRAAAELPPLEIGGKPPTKKYRAPDTSYHFDQEEEVTKIGGFKV
jgi:hypothetical protein